MSALLTSFAASLQEEEEQALSTQSDLAFTPRPSLWEHVSSLLQPAERSEAKLMIGASTILDNQQLHSEVRSLVDIVTCLQAAHTPQRWHSSQSAPPVVASASSGLPNGIPPLRLRGFEADRTAHLKDEIAQLVAAIRDKARERGDGDTSRIWSPRSERERHIVAMVEKESSATSRSMTHSSRCSTGRPSTASTARSTSSVSASASRPASSSVSTSSLSSSVVSLSSLSIFTLDSAVTRIQAALQEEREELLRDVDELRSLIEDEEEQADERRKDEQESTTAPSDMELRALNKHLRDAVEEEERAERTRRLLSSVPARASFKAASKLRHAVKAEQLHCDDEQANNDETQPHQQCVDEQSDESVQSMLDSLEHMETAFFHNGDSQQPTAPKIPPTAPLNLPLSRTVPPPSPPVNSPHSYHPSGSIFIIRPSSSSLSSHSSAASSPRAARVSPQPHIRAADGLKAVFPRRMQLPQVMT